MVVENLPMKGGLNVMEADIFNDILGPVMIGPSSSHTAGPVRLGRMAKELSEGIKKIDVKFSKTGSYAGAYKGQGSDLGFIAGLLGWDTDDERIPEARIYADKAGFKISFHIVDTKFNHPNTALIDFNDDKGKKITVETVSCGGGIVKITGIDGISINIEGDCNELLIFFECSTDYIRTESDNILREFDAKIINVNTFFNGAKGILNYKLSGDIDAAMVKKLAATVMITKVCTIDSVLPVISGNGSKIPYTNTKEMIEFYGDQDVPLWEAALLYEKCRSGWNEEKIFDYCHKILAIMENSVTKGIALKSNKNFMFLTPKAAEINKSMQTGAFVSSGILEYATVIATAVMEYNRSMGCVVASPTAGSCGVIPAVLLSLRKEKKLESDACIKGLLAAGLIGVFIYHQATFAAETGGCQAENGSASTMAAAALTDMMGYGYTAGIKAAALAMQNMLGLICDPVCGSVEIPCISRNASAAANAVVSANMVIGGFDPFIPLDEVINAMHEVGQMMPRELKCTVLGGLCSTHTARNIKKESEL